MTQINFQYGNATIVQRCVENVPPDSRWLNKFSTHKAIASCSSSLLHQHHRHPAIGQTHAIGMFNLATLAAKLTHDRWIRMVGFDEGYGVPRIYNSRRSAASNTIRMLKLFKTPNANQDVLPFCWAHHSSCRLSFFHCWKLLCTC